MEGTADMATAIACCDSSCNNCEIVCEGCNLSSGLADIDAERLAWDGWHGAGITTECDCYTMCPTCTHHWVDLCSAGATCTCNRCFDF
jgi:hypothetical protein